MVGTSHSALCRISVQYARLVLPSLLQHNPSRLATVGGIGQGRRSLSLSLKLRPS